MTTREKNVMILTCLVTMSNMGMITGDPWYSGEVGLLMRSLVNLADKSTMEGLHHDH